MNINNENKDLIKSKLQEYEYLQKQIEIGNHIIQSDYYRINIEKNKRQLTSTGKEIFNNAFICSSNEFKLEDNEIEILRTILLSMLNSFINKRKEQLNSIEI